MNRRWWLLSAIALAVAGFAAVLAALFPSHGPPASQATNPALPAASFATEPILPLPEALKLDAGKVALGRRLFHDPRLSQDQTIACATCHLLGKGGADGQRHSVGVAGKTLSINTPTVFNSAFNFRQFWDGRAPSLEDQIDGPLQHTDEMGATWVSVIEKLKADPSYSAAFAALYRDGVQVKNVKDAIATFERSLITPNSRFDRFLQGERMALAEPEIKGYHLFRIYGCVACHQGANVGGNMYQRMGIMGDYFSDRGGITDADLGRFNVTKRDEDKHVFKVPSLRNVSQTAPYFHDGSVATLEQAVAVMGKYQLGVAIPAADIALIVAFLSTLSGDLPQ